MLLIAHRLRQAKPVRIIGVAVVQPRAAVDRAREPPPVRPAEGRPVIPARRVAYRIIADGLPVVGGQQVFPVAVAVGVALADGVIVIPDDESNSLNRAEDICPVIELIVCAMAGYHLY